MYGVNARTATGSGEGTFSLALQVVSDGLVLWQDVITSTVTEYNCIVSIICRIHLL